MLANQVTGNGRWISHFTSIVMSYAGYYWFSKSMNNREDQCKGG